MGFLMDFVEFIIIFFPTLVVVFWLVHLVMSVGESKNNYIWGWSNYRKFKKHFSEVTILKEGFDKNYKKSYFGKDFYFHASQVKFFEKGMVFNNPISFMLAIIHIRITLSKLNPFKQDKSKITRVKW